MTLNTAKEPESCIGHKLSFCFTFLCDPDLGRRTLILIMTYHLIIVYLFMKSNYTCFSSLQVLQRKDLTFNHGRTHGALFRGYGYVPLRNGGNVVRRMGTQQQLDLQPLIKMPGIPLMMPRLSVKINVVCFGTFLSNC